MAPQGVKRKRPRKLAVSSWFFSLEVPGILAALPLNARILSKQPNQIAHRPVASLRPDPRNPRLHTTRQIKQIAASIRAFGFVVPILISSDGIVVSGHGRLEAARLLGHLEVPTLELANLSRQQLRAFAIADNRLTEVARWDDAMLGEIFAELSSIDLDFSLEVTGFTMGEIDLRIEGLQPFDAQETSAVDPADEPQDEAAQSAVCLPGDLWELGPHRVLCGNSLEAAAFASLLGERRGDMVFIDPPYNVPIDGHVIVKRSAGAPHREFAMAAGEMTSAQFTEFLGSVFALLASNTNPGSLHYVCMDWRHLRETLEAGALAYDDLKNICVWAKDKGGMGSLYRSQHEMVLVFKHGTASHRNNVELGRYGRNRTNVWSYPGANSAARHTEEGNLLAVHPTVKPIALVADAILDCTARGDLVLDCFLGSGTTLLAAERVGRIFSGLELDPRYVDTAIRRWQRITGQSAVNADTKTPFDQSAARQVRIRKRVTAKDNS